MARFMSTMGEEMGEDLSDNLSETMESDENGPLNRMVMTGCGRHCHAFSLDRLFQFPHPGNSIRSLVRHMGLYPTRFFNGQRAQERANDDGGDLPLSQDYSTYTLSLPQESPDSRFQAWKRMALRTFGSGTVDSRSHQNHAGVVKDRLH